MFNTDSGTASASELVGLRELVVAQAAQLEVSQLDVITAQARLEEQHSLMQGQARDNAALSSTVAAQSTAIRAQDELLRQVSTQAAGEVTSREQAIADRAERRRQRREAAKGDDEGGYGALFWIFMLVLVVLVAGAAYHFMTSKQQKKGRFNL